MIKILEGKKTYIESLNNIKNMKNDISPDPDGFIQSSIIKFHWKNNSHCCLMSANKGFERGMLSISKNTRNYINNTKERQM